MQFLAKTFLPSILVTGLSVILVNSVNPDATNTPTTPTTVEMSTRTARQGRIYRMRQRSRDYRLLTIRQNILRHLQWSSPPTTMDPEFRRELMANITQNSDDEWARNRMTQYDDEDYLAVYLPPTTLHNRPLWTNPGNGILNMYFDLYESSSPENQVEVRNGTLKILMKSRRECACGNDRDYDLILLYLHRYTDNLRRSRRRAREITELIAVEMFRMHPENGVRIEFNVTETAAMWVSDSSSNKGFKIEAKDSRGRFLNAKKIFEHARYLSRPWTAYKRFRYRAVAPALSLKKVVTPGFNI